MFINASDYRFFKRVAKVLRGMKVNGEIQSQFSVCPVSEKTTQGHVGILSLKKNPHLKLVYKISKEEDTVVLHEYEILHQLERAAIACPHFVKLHGLAKYSSPVRISPISNEAAPSGSVCVERDILFMEFVRNSGSLANFLEREGKVDPAAVLSLIAQVILSLGIIHSLGITHNDIHCDNILVQKCSPNTSLKYVFKNREISIPTFGNIAVLIDFGLGRSAPKSGEESPLLGSFYFTHLGFHTDLFSPNTDFVRFLCNLRKLTSERFPKIGKWCSRLLMGMRGIDRSIGWDLTKSESPIEAFCGKVAKTFPGVFLLKKMVWAENLQALVSRPVQNMDADVRVLASFFENWKKFEERIRSLHELNYLFKSLVFSVKLWKEDYLRQDPAAVKRIEISFLEKYEKAIKFHCPAVDYDNMVSSLILGAAYLEGFFFRHLEALRAKLPKRAGKLAKQDCDEEVWKSFEKNFAAEMRASAPKDIKNLEKVCFLTNLAR